MIERFSGSRFYSVPGTPFACDAKTILSTQGEEPMNPEQGTENGEPRTCSGALLRHFPRDWQLETVSLIGLEHEQEPEHGGDWKNQKEGNEPAE
jgi:hypothetical protein